MESGEGTRNEEETIKQEKQGNPKKEKKNEKISQSRHAPSPPEAQNVLQEQNEPEEQEVQIKEETGRKKLYLPVYQHSRNTSGKTKKMLVLPFAKIFKKRLKNIQCFYCLRLGHIKENCDKRKIDQIFECLIQMAKNIKEIQKRRFKTKKMSSTK